MWYSRRARDGEEMSEETLSPTSSFYTPPGSRVRPLFILDVRSCGARAMSRTR